MFALAILVVAFVSAVSAQCPDRCIDPTWARVQCESFPDCTVIPCTRIVRGLERNWAMCSSPSPTPSPSASLMPCPDRCIDPTWAREKCAALPHCTVLPCTRVVDGVERDWASCSSPLPTPSPSLMPCPDRCIDPTWAREKCAGLPHCTVLPCTRVVNGVERDWASCSSPTPTPSVMPCPDRCIDPTWAEEKCRMLPHCEVVPCTRIVRGVERSWAKCSPIED